MDLEYQTARDGEKGIITVQGDLDNEQAGEALKRAFVKLTDQKVKTIVLDLTSVEIINSYGIGKILTLQRKIKADDGVLMLKPLSGFTKEVFELLYLDRIIPIEGQEQETKLPDGNA